MHAIILAGGFATRLWPLTEKIAKPLIPVAGKPLINFLIEKIPSNISITISTNQVFSKDFFQWKQLFFPNRDINIFIEDSDSETKKKGALAATALCIMENDITEDILLLAGDNYFGFCFNQFLKMNTYQEPVLAAYDIGSIDEAKKFGVVVPQNKTHILEFEEKPEQPSSCLVSTGAYIFPHFTIPDIVKYSEDHSDDLGGIFEYFIQKDTPVRYFSFSEQWYDIGSFPSFMQANKTLLNPPKNISTTCVKDEKTIIKESCVIEDNVTLENVYLENAIILAGSSLKNVDVRNCLVGKNCFIENRDFSEKIIRDETIILD